MDLWRVERSLRLCRQHGKKSVISSSRTFCYITIMNGHENQMEIEPLSSKDAGSIHLFEIKKNHWIISFINADKAIGIISCVPHPGAYRLPEAFQSLKAISPESGRECIHRLCCSRHRWWLPAGYYHEWIHGEQVLWAQGYERFSAGYPAADSNGLG